MNDDIANLKSAGPPTHTGASITLGGLSLTSAADTVSIVKSNSRCFIDAKRVNPITEPLVNRGLNQSFTSLEDFMSSSSGVTILLGGPATGKTSLLRNMAKVSGRPVIVSDIKQTAVPREGKGPIYSYQLSPETDGPMIIAHAGEPDYIVQPSTTGRTHSAGISELLISLFIATRSTTKPTIILDSASDWFRYNTTGVGAMKSGVSPDFMEDLKALSTWTIDNHVHLIITLNPQDFSDDTDDRRGPTTPGQSFMFKLLKGACTSVVLLIEGDYSQAVISSRLTDDRINRFMVRSDNKTRNATGDEGNPSKRSIIVGIDDAAVDATENALMRSVVRSIKARNALEHDAPVVSTPIKPHLGII